MATKKKEGFFLRMLSAPEGGVSSKRIIGSFGFLVLLVATVILMFTNPGFPGISDIVTMLIITSSSLLGLTALENIQKRRRK